MKTTAKTAPVNRQNWGLQGVAGNFHRVGVDLVAALWRDPVAVIIALLFSFFEPLAPAARGATGPLGCRTW
ncbi:MAG: hypothetical protein IPH54_11605 [Rhodoferax sp.]|nr:hypothetical protein [Rhodoferax sp.]